MFVQPCCAPATVSCQPALHLMACRCCGLLCLSAIHCVCLMCLLQAAHGGDNDVTQPARGAAQEAQQPLPACLPARPPACLPARPPACLPRIQSCGMHLVLGGGRPLCLVSSLSCPSCPSCPRASPQCLPCPSPLSPCRALPWPLLPSLTLGQSWHLPSPCTTSQRWVGDGGRAAQAGWGGAGEVGRRWRRSANLSSPPLTHHPGVMIE